MWSEIALVFCAILALQVSLGVCLPAGKSENIHIESSSATPSEAVERDEDDGYQVILQSPNQVLKVEVVDADGNTAIHEMEVESTEPEEDVKSVYQVSEERSERTRRRGGDTRMNHRRTGSDDETSSEVIESKRGSIAERTDERTKRYKCNWRRLYRLYLDKRKGGSRVTRSRRKQIREAFKIVCENPEEAITYLLNLDQ